MCSLVLVFFKSKFQVKKKRILRFVTELPVAEGEQPVPVHTKVYFENGDQHMARVSIRSVVVCFFACAVQDVSNV